MRKEILKQCCHKCDDYSKSWEVTCRDCECHQPNMKTKSTKECCKECKRLNNATSMMSGESALICVDDHCPFCHQPPQSKVKATCLSLDCPERTGGECRHQPQQPTQESWESKIDAIYNSHVSENKVARAILQQVAKILESKRHTNEDCKDDGCGVNQTISDLLEKIKNIKCQKNL